MSGTEHVAPLLYSLIRMLKPQTVVEFGSGYTTPYILQALKDNEDEFNFNQKILKSRVVKNYAKLSDPARGAMLPDDWLLDETTQEVYGQEPVVPIPSFYAKQYKPRLFTFEVLPENDVYVSKLSRLVCDLKLDSYFRLSAGCRVTDYVKLVPEERLPIDFAWNDFGNKKRFYDETYDSIRDDGGIMAVPQHHQQREGSQRGSGQGLRGDPAESAVAESRAPDVSRTPQIHPEKPDRRAQDHRVQGRILP